MCEADFGGVQVDGDVAVEQRDGYIRYWGGERRARGHQQPGVNSAAGKKYTQQSNHSDSAVMHGRTGGVAEG
jgi:hypothetical protein